MAVRSLAGAEGALAGLCERSFFAKDFNIPGCQAGSFWLLINTLPNSKAERNDVTLSLLCAVSSNTFDSSCFSLAPDTSPLLYRSLVSIANTPRSSRMSTSFISSSVELLHLGRSHHRPQIPLRLDLAKFWRRPKIRQCLLITSDITVRTQRALCHGPDKENPLFDDLGDCWCKLLHVN